MAQISKIIGSVLGEPMVDDQLGSFNDIGIPVTPTSEPALWGMPEDLIEYLKPQTQEEHNALLNKYYAQRETDPQWKEKGIEEEKKSPHYNSKDVKLRTNLGAKSSVIKGMAYDPNDNLAMLKMGNKWYTYSATPEQFQRFLTFGSLGREMNNIKNDKSHSMTKIDVRKTPNLSSVLGMF